MIICKNCKSTNDDNLVECSSCGKSLLLATLECIISDNSIEVGAIWELNSKDYSVGRSLSCDIIIPGQFVSRNHFNLKYNSEESAFYYESLARNLLEFEKQTYKILDGAIIPLPEGIELKLNYVD